MTDSEKRALAGERAINALVRLSRMSLDHFCLEDCVYDVRDREGLGWDGPAVVEFSGICVEINTVLDLIGEQSEDRL